MLRNACRIAIASSLSVMLLCCAPSALAGEPTTIPYEGCGTLTIGVECPIFVGDDGTSFSIPAFGEFQIGDYVHVVGEICPKCPHICQQGAVFITQQIMACGGAIDECGTLQYQGSLPFFCIVFQSDSGLVYAINNPGVFDVTDRVRVIGELDPATCPGVDCGPIEGCIDVSSIIGCADIDGDGVVDINDLLQVINGWGQCVETKCPGDVNGDNQTNVDDLLLVIENWS